MAKKPQTVSEEKPALVFGSKTCEGSSSNNNVIDTPILTKKRKQKCHRINEHKLQILDYYHENGSNKKATACWVVEHFGPPFSRDSITTGQKDRTRMIPSKMKAREGKFPEMEYQVSINIFS